MFYCENPVIKLIVLVVLIQFSGVGGGVGEKMSRFKVLINHTEVPRIAYDILEPVVNVTTVKANTREDFLNNVAGVHGIFSFGHQRFDKEIFDKAGPQLKVVGSMSAGLEHIDIDEMKKRGIHLSNTPHVLDDAVADTAVFLALGAARRAHEARQMMNGGKWQILLGLDIEGSTVGIVGLGGIGQTIVKRLKSFKVAKFLYTGHREKEEGKQLDAQFVNLDTLVKESDFVFISCPLTNETRNMFNSEIFSKMKNTSILINIARGGVVDQDALIEALKSGQIYAAGLDVMTPEPLPADHELLKLQNVVLLPHVGSATINTRNAMAKLTAQNILRALGDQEMLTPVF